MIIYCLGMQSSGSTWIYNVLREIFAVNKLPFTAYRVETFEELKDDRAFGAVNAVFRGHNVDSYLLRALALGDVRAILSFRDPRDAVASFMQRFGTQFLPVCNDVMRNLASLVSAGSSMPNLSFFFEDRFTDDISTVRQCADFIGVPLTDAQASGIFEKYRSANVRRFIASLGRLPADRIYVDETANVMDRETSFHATHISDGQIGKWRTVLAPRDAALADAAFAGYAHALARKSLARKSLARKSLARKSLEREGVGRETPERETPERETPERETLERETLGGPAEALRIRFDSDLFCPIDDPVKFTRVLQRSEVSGALGIKALDHIYLPLGRWRLHGDVSVHQPFKANLCQNGRLLFSATSQEGWFEQVVVNRLHDHPYDLHVEGLDGAFATSLTAERLPD